MILCCSLVSDLEPEWLDDIEKNGELFYLELSEGEEEVALARAASSRGVPTNHVRFSEKEAEIITDLDKKPRREKGEPTLKRLAKMLRRKRRSSQRRGGKDSSAPSSRPASILKNQPGQQLGVGVQQQLKDVCVYLNPKRLGGSSPALSQNGGLLEALLGVVHRPSWVRGHPAAGRQEERLSVHGLVPNSPAMKCGQVLIGETCYPFPLSNPGDKQLTLFVPRKQTPLITYEVQHWGPLRD